MDSKNIRVFPRRTAFTPKDEYAFVGDPPMEYMLPDWRDVDEVHVSVTFTWDLSEGKRLAMAWGQWHPTVVLGGPAYSSRCERFIPGVYVKPGVVFTSRGCNNQCPWCLVPEREGKLHEIADFPSGRVIQDNNYLQCSNEHRHRVFQMLEAEKDVEFTGGLDPRLLTDKIADEIRSLRIKQVFLAADTKESVRFLSPAVKRLGLPWPKIRCYVLLAFDGQTLEEGEAQLHRVLETGCMPHAQLYQPEEEWIVYPKPWKDLNRTWSRPAAMWGFYQASRRQGESSGTAGKEN